MHIFQWKTLDSIFTRGPNSFQEIHCWSLTFYLRYPSDICLKSFLRCPVPPERDAPWHSVSCTPATRYVDPFIDNNMLVSANHAGSMEKVSQKLFCSSVNVQNCISLILLLVPMYLNKRIQKIYNTNTNKKRTISVERPRRQLETAAPSSQGC